MRILKSLSWALAGLILLTGASSIWQTEVTAAESTDSHKSIIGKLDNAACQSCHEGKKMDTRVCAVEFSILCLIYINSTSRVS